MSSSYDLMIIEWMFLAGVASFMLTGLLRRYAVKKNLLDIPGSRSSHSVPTPRGGGLAIVLIVLIISLLFWWRSLLPAATVMPVIGAGGLVAVVGWMDDHCHLAAGWRLLAHFMASVWALFWLSGLPPIIMFGEVVDFGWCGDVLAVFYLVWFLNLFNFMDGINGIASVEAITVCFGGVILSMQLPAGSQEYLLQILLSFATLGFLLWNFPKAKIFMGDAGSGFIGIVLGILSIQAAWVAPELFWGWMILLGVFIVDSTMTLIRRVLRGERFYEAHRIHAYQYAARRWGHVSVTVSVALINVLWLFPVAYFAVNSSKWGSVFMVLAYLPLIILAFRLDAGRPEKQLS